MDGISQIVLKKTALWQFVRYLFAGGFAFVVDFGTLILLRECVFPDVAWGVYLSVIFAFFAGHITNYVLSLWIVFNSSEERRAGLTAKAFVLFAVVGVIGVGVTEVGMWVGYGLFHGNYIVVKVVMAAIVMVWNFVGRKLILISK